MVCLGEGEVVVLCFRRGNRICHSCGSNARFAALMGTKVWFVWLGEWLLPGLWGNCGKSTFVNKGRETCTPDRIPKACMCY